MQQQQHRHLIGLWEVGNESKMKRVRIEAFPSANKKEKFASQSEYTSKRKSNEKKENNNVKWRWINQSIDRSVDDRILFKLHSIGHESRRR